MKLRDEPLFVKGLLQHLDTPRSLAVWIAFKHKEWECLANLRWSPLSYVTSSLPLVVCSPMKRIVNDKRATDLFRKVPFATGDRLNKRAMESWDAAERKCHATNVMLRSLDFGSLTGPELTLVQFLDKVKKRTSRILGPLPPLLKGRFSGGTIFEWSDRMKPSVLDKVWGIPPHCTSAAEPIFRLDYDETSWGRLRCLHGLPYIGSTNGNRWVGVPKNALTNRSVCPEPLGNLWCQLAVGGYLKQRLESHGLRGFAPRVPRALALYLFPNDPQPTHAGLARLGSVTGENATIDLSDASDTKAYELVRRVIPDDWFALLDSIRSPQTLVSRKRDNGKGSEKRWVRLDKFSSMGNGFTFELMTLILCAIFEVGCNLTAGKDLWVFGDDIIVPATVAKSGCAMLRVLGFTPNPKKTFLEGPFRESCGGEFWNGTDVSSVAFKLDEIGPQEAIAYHNALLRVGYPGVLLQALRDSLPFKFRLYGPPEMGDTVLHYGGKPTYAQSRGLTLVKQVSFKPLTRVKTERWGLEPLNYLLSGDWVVRPDDGVVPVTSWGPVMDPSTVAGGLRVQNESLFLTHKAGRSRR